MQHPSVAPKSVMKTVFIVLTALTIGMLKYRPSLKASYDASLVSRKKIPTNTLASYLDVSRFRGKFVHLPYLRCQPPPPTHRIHWPTRFSVPTYKTTSRRSPPYDVRHVYCVPEKNSLRKIERTVENKRTVGQVWDCLANSCIASAATFESRIFSLI